MVKLLYISTEVYQFFSLQINHSTFFFFIKEKIQRLQETATPYLNTK